MGNCTSKSTAAVTFDERSPQGVSTEQDHEDYPPSEEENEDEEYGTITYSGAERSQSHHNGTTGGGGYDPTMSVDVPPAKPALLLPCDSGFHITKNGRNGWKFDEIYTAGEELGRGAFGAVYTGTHKFARQPGMDNDDDGGDSFDADYEWKHVAIKRTRPNSLDLRDARNEITTYGHLERRCQEVKTLKRLQEGSPHLSPVLYLYEIFMSGRDFYMVTELLHQELDDWRMEAEMFTEKMAIDICRSVLSAIDFMHRYDNGCGRLTTVCLVGSFRSPTEFPFFALPF